MNIPNTISSSSIKYIQIFLDVSDTGYLLFKKLLIFLFFMVKQNTPKKKKNIIWCKSEATEVKILCCEM